MDTAMSVAKELMQIATIVLMCLILREQLRNSRKIDRHEREIARLKAEIDSIKRHQK